jgi:hypothetical protein
MCHVRPPLPVIAIHRPDRLTAIPRVADQKPAWYGTNGGDEMTASGPPSSRFHARSTFEMQ